MRSIDVDPTQDVVVVELDAASDDALGDYLDQLNAGEELPKWHIVKLAAIATEARTGGAVNPASSAVIGHAVSIARLLETARR